MLFVLDVSGVGNFSDTDSEVDIVPRLLGNNSLWLNGLNDSDTDSDDEDFTAELQDGENPRNDDNDTDSLTGITNDGIYWMNFNDFLL